MVLKDWRSEVERIWIEPNQFYPDYTCVCVGGKKFPFEKVAYHFDGPDPDLIEFFNEPHDLVYPGIKEFVQEWLDNQGN